MKDEIGQVSTQENIGDNGLGTLNIILIIILLSVTIIAIYYAIKYMKRQNIHIKFYNKLLLKMGKCEKSYRYACSLYRDKQYEKAICIIEENIRTSRLPHEEIEQWRDLEKKINQAIEQQEVNELREQIEKLLKDKSFDSAKQLLQSKKTKRYKDVESLNDLIVTKEILDIQYRVRNGINSGNIKDVFIIFNEALKQYGIIKISEIDSLLKDFLFSFSVGL